MIRPAALVCLPLAGLALVLGCGRSADPTPPANEPTAPRPADAPAGRSASTVAAPPPVGPAGDLDPAVAAVIGAESPAYSEAGYKGVVLGTRRADLEADKGLTRARADQPWVLLGPAGEEEFVFDAGERLVCYTRSYAGGPDDYLDQLVELFGRSDRPPRESASSTPDGASRRASVEYTFPHVLARVVFVTTARPRPGSAPPTVAERTNVVVLDRAWATAMLAASVSGKRAAVGWVRAVGEKVKGGEVVLADLPPLAGCDGRESPKALEVVQFHDTLREAQNAAAKPARPKPTAVAAVERPWAPSGRRTVVRVHFVFGRYTPLATPPVYRQDVPPAGLGGPPAGNNAVGYTPFANLVTELNVALAREAFPPKGDRVEYVRPASGAAYYEWRTADGWQVRCRTDDALTVEWVGGKGL